MLKHFLRDFLIPFIAGAICGFAVLSYGETPCQDVLALQHPRFPVKKLIDQLPEHSCIGLLDWTFGTSMTPISRVLDSGKIDFVRVHLFNGPGLRNRQLGRYEPHFGYTVTSFDAAWKQNGGKLRRHLANRVKRYCRLLSARPDISLEISPTLEHNLSGKAFRRQALVVRRNCPRAVVVDNPVAGVSSAKGFQIERHGVKVRGLKAPCSVSLDGDDALDVDVPKFLAANPQCRMFLWSHSYNCRDPRASFVDPRKRTKCPSENPLWAMIHSIPLP